jgi:ComF family protein
LTLAAAAWSETKRLGHGLLALLSPSECSACGAGTEGGAFCDTCAVGLCECDPFVCATCASPARRHGLCGPCRQRLWPLDGAICAFEYAAPLSDALARLKYEGRDEIASPLAACFARGLAGRRVWSSDSLLLPIPLHPRRLRERGFDQSWLLARGLWSTLPRPRPDTAPRLLRRTRHTRPQVGLGRRARERNLDASFCATPSARPAIAGRDVVLIDDVLTTGATLRAAAVALHDMGARSVFGITLARALT